MIIYKATNKINGKSYIGQTIHSLQKRKQAHISASNSRRRKGRMVFHQALKKHKPENFTWEVLRKCNNKEELNMYECDYIGLYNTYNKGYNSTYGGSGMGSHKKMSDKQRKKTSKRMSKPVMIEGKYFCSIIEAAEFIGVTPATVSKRIRVHNSGYYRWQFVSYPK